MPNNLDSNLVNVQIDKMVDVGVSKNKWTPLFAFRDMQIKHKADDMLFLLIFVYSYATEYPPIKWIGIYSTCMHASMLERLMALLVCKGGRVENEQLCTR